MKDSLLRPSRCPTCPTGAGHLKAKFLKTLSRLLACQGCKVVCQAVPGIPVLQGRLMSPSRNQWPATGPVETSIGADRERLISSHFCLSTADDRTRPLTHHCFKSLPSRAARRTPVHELKQLKHFVNNWSKSGVWNLASSNKRTESPRFCLHHRKSLEELRGVPFHPHS